MGESDELGVKSVGWTNAVKYGGLVALLAFSLMGDLIHIFHIH